MVGLERKGSYEIHSLSQGVRDSCWAVDLKEGFLCCKEATSRPRVEDRELFPVVILPELLTIIQMHLTCSNPVPSLEMSHWMLKLSQKYRKDSLKPTYENNLHFLVFLSPLARTPEYMLNNNYARNYQHESALLQMSSSSLMYLTQVLLVLMN